MKVRNNILKLCFVLISIVYLMVAQAQTKENSQKRHVFDGQWKLIQYKDLKSNKVMNEPTNLNRSVVLKFEDDGLQGHIEGHTIRNSIHGQYFIRKDNGIQFLSVGIETNDRTVKEWGDNMDAALLDASSYSFQKDTLSIKYNDNRQAMLFVRSYEEREMQNQIHK
jgi:hypothetical protein